MFGKKFFVLTGFFILSACAEPKYLIANDSLKKSSNEKSQTSCSLQFKNSGYCLSWQWEKAPTETETGSFVFRVFTLDALDQFPVLKEMPINPEVILWMPSMGHGSSPVTVTQIGVGSYRASKVFFIMAGEWDLQFQIKNENTVLDEAIDQITF